MNEQTRLLASVNLARSLLEHPTTLPPKTLAAARTLAQNIGDRCWFNAGWYAANPNSKLRGSASTTSLQSELAPLVDLLQSRQKPKKARGAPVKNMIAGPDALIICEYLRDREGRSLASIIDVRIRSGDYALDKRKTTAAHVKRIERIIEKLKRAPAPNVVPLPRRKK